ncbi:MAG: alpha-E domain-containing protein [Magnetococcales bacterium]|nr:alpha-E domain-containing protein [Magnetococcales bacterium]
MLSRVAENIYWMGRNLERVENGARLINVTKTMLLDLPICRTHPHFGWGQLITITGHNELFHSLYQQSDEPSVLSFLISQPNNHSSLLGAITCARDNLRTIRDIFPREFWESLNQLYLCIREYADTGIETGYWDRFLRIVVRKCQELIGLLNGTLSRGTAFDFFRIGQHIERADMTTRILDVRSSYLALHASDGSIPFEQLQWLNLLRCVSGEQMYRRQVNPRIIDIDVLLFLLRDRSFPRTFCYCVHEVSSALATMVNNSQLLERVGQLEQTVEESDLSLLMQHGLSKFMDDLQLALGQLHQQIAATYFSRQ